MIGLTLVEKPLESYLVIREPDGDRELTAAECRELFNAAARIEALEAALQEATLILEQAQSCIMQETPEDMTLGEAEDDTLSKIRAFLNHAALDKDEEMSKETYWVAIDQLAEIKRLRARIEALEAALRTIRDDGKNCVDHCRRQADKALRISARAALDKDTGKCLEP